MSAAAPAPPRGGSEGEGEGEGASEHEEKEAHRCEWEGCGASLPSAEALHDHLLLAHAVRPPWRCQWRCCRLSARRWPYRSDLAKHLAAHSPAHKPFACPRCHFRCALPWRLSAHIRARHHDAPNAKPSQQPLQPLQPLPQQQSPPPQQQQQSRAQQRQREEKNPLEEAAAAWAESPRAAVAVPVTVEGEGEQRQVVVELGARVGDVAALIARELLPAGVRVARLEKVRGPGDRVLVDPRQYAHEFLSMFCGCPAHVVPAPAAPTDEDAAQRERPVAARETQ